MSLFFNGFDFFNGTGTDQLQSVWDVGSAVDSISAVGSGAYSYGRYIQNGFNSLLKTFANIPGAATNWATLYGGFHWYPGATLGDDSAWWVYMMDGGSVQSYLTVTAGGIIKLRRAGGTVLATASNALTAGVWNWVAFKIVINNTTGSFILKLNGIEEINATGLDTQDTANAYITKIGFSRPGNSFAAQGNLDNVFLYDGSDAAPWNDVSAERRIYFQLANGDGALIDWTASAGNRYQCVDENPPNTTDYISSATVGQQDSITKAASGVAAIDAVQTWMYAQKDDATARGIKLFLRSNAGTLYYGSEKLMATSWLYYFSQWLTDPATAAAWAVSNFDNYQIGVEVTT